MNRDPTTFELEARLDAQLVRDWGAARAAFEHYRATGSESRLEALGRLFDQLGDWIERGVVATTIRHFLIVPKEMTVARVFATLVRRNQLPDSHRVFLLWVEAQVLASVADPQRGDAVAHGDPLQPNDEVFAWFQRRPVADRALLFLFFVEGQDVRAAAEAVGVSPLQATQRIQSVLTELAAAGLGLPQEEGTRCRPR